MVRRINKQLLVDSSKGSESLSWIGILDVFGFENFEFNNSFEQFCINFANEKLQQFFNICIIEEEQKEYVREALPWRALKVPDNQDTIDLVEGKPSGIISVLDSTCMMPKGSDEIFINNLFEVHKKHAKMTRAMSRVLANQKNNLLERRGSTREKFVGFNIEHYAGTVCYNAQGFLDKNADSTHADTLALFMSANNAVVKILLDPEAQFDDSNPNKNVEKPPSGAHARRGSISTKTFLSVGNTFQKQLSSLMETLKSTSPHFVRCVNPNQFKRSEMFDADYVRPQLRCGGIIEALRVLKLGYPSRIPYQQIYERYGQILPKDIMGSGDQGAEVTALRQKDFCEVIFTAFGISPKDYQFGLTKVFFKPGKQEVLEQLLGVESKVAPEMFAKIRSLMIRKRIKRLRAGVLLLVRFFNWIKRARQFRKIARFVASVVNMSKAVSAPLKDVKRKRSALTIQSVIRSHVAQYQRTKQSNSSLLLQRFARRSLRRKKLQAALHSRVEATRVQRNKNARVCQKFIRHRHIRKNLAKELAVRVKATQNRKEHQAALDKAKRDAEDKERLAQMEMERQRAEALQREAEKKSEEQRKKDETEKTRLEEEEKQRIRSKLEERQRKEQAEKERTEKEEKELEEAERRLREEQERKETAEREKKRLAEEKAEKERRWHEQLRKLDEDKEREQDLRLHKEAKEAEDVQNSQTPPPDGSAPPPADGPPAPVPDQAEQVKSQMRLVLLNGGKFLKYGKRGDPHIRFICVNILGNLHWDKDPMDFRKPFPSSNCFPLSSVLKVVKGKQTDILQRSVAKSAPEYLCFSIISSERTLDLQAVNAMERDLWVIAMESAVQEARAGMVDFYNGVYETDPEKKPGAAKKERSMSLRLANGILSLGKSFSKSNEPNPAIPPPAAMAKFGTFSGGSQPKRASIIGLSNSSSSISDKDSSVTADDREPSVSISRSQLNQVENSVNGAGSLSVSLSRDSMADDENFSVEKGNHMLMFGRVGRPQVVFLNCLRDRLVWQKEAIRSPDDPFVNLSEIEAVRRGKVTEVLLKRSVDALSPPECCFSVILRTGRTLDFQCGSEEKRDKWVAALLVAVKRSKDDAGGGATVSGNASGNASGSADNSTQFLPKSVRQRASIIDGGVFNGESPTDGSGNPMQKSPSGFQPKGVNVVDPSLAARRASQVEYSQTMQEKSIAEEDDADD